MTNVDLNRLHRDFATSIVSFQEAVARRLGMTAAERKCAGIIAELVTTTPKELADLTGLTSGAITGIVDRLEHAGFAARKPNPADRRSVLVVARQSNRLARVSAPLFASLTEKMTKLAARYSPAERALIERHLRDTIEIVSEEIKKVQDADRS